MQFISRAKKYIKYHKLYYKSNIKYLKFKKLNKIGYNINCNIMLKSSHLKMLIQLIKYILKPYKRILKIRLKIFPDFGKTQKPKDIRMGRGKGEVSTRVVFCRGGIIFLELLNSKNIPIEFIEYIFYECSMKLSVNTHILTFNKYD